MLSEIKVAWLTYFIFYILLAIVNLVRSLKNVQAYPSIAFSLFFGFGHLYLVLQSSDTISDEDQLRSRDPAVTQYPVYSIILFFGMVHSQLVYIKHINSALQNHRRWASLHPVTITEKGDATTSMDSDSRQLIAKIFNGSAIPPILRPWAFWAYISLLAFHIVFILVFLCIKTLIQEQQTMSLLSAIFLTLIMTLTVVNIILVIYTGSKCHTESISRIMEQNKRDYIILFLIPALFMFSAFSMTAISWATFMADTHQFPALYDNSLLRIILEGVLFYIPITIILVAHMARKNSPFNDSIQKVLKERPHHYDRSRNYSRVKQDTGLETVPL